MRKFLAFLFILSLILGATTSVDAQNQDFSSATLYNTDYSAFPAVSALVDVFDAQGIFASGLNPEAVTVIENGQPIPVNDVNEMAVPLQLVIAVNQGLPLDSRDSTGFSRYQRAVQVLATWAQSRPPDLPDDFSLVSQAGVVINHAGATDFIAGLSSFQPDFRAATPNLQSLAIALDTVSAQTPRLGMKRAILLITPHMDDPNVAATMEPLIQRAVENDIHVFIWFIDLEVMFNTTSAAVFNSLAIQTGGTVFNYSGVERFPDPENYFAPLRRIYTLIYTSRLATSGAHTVQVQANLPSGTVTSNEQSINLDVQPPNPIPITPSLQITRQAPQEDPFNTELLLPMQQELEIIVEFPDQHPRPLARTTLYVDGQVMDENTMEPFNLFVWDLTSYTSSGQHQIVVEAVDTIGLSKSSMAIPIMVTVILPPSGPAALLAKYRTPITYGAIAIAGLALFLILLSGRLRIPSLRAAQETRRADADPLTQPIRTMEEIPPQLAAPAKEKIKKPRAKSKKAAADTKSNKEAMASFLRINADGQPVVAAPLSILEKEIVFGTDPVQCTQILDDPSISSVHARLRQTEDGGFLLQDSNSIAGTWVNYEPIPREGYRLAHGDMVHFGQLSYRFTLRTHSQERKPTITVQLAEE